MQNVELNNKKKKKTIIVVIALLVVVLIVGTSYALWRLTLIQSGSNTINTACLNLVLKDDTDAFTLNEAVPMTDTEGKLLTPYTFTVTNTCATETKYVVNLETISDGDKVLSDEYVKANLLKGTTEVFSDKLLSTYINEEKVIQTASEAYMLDQGTLKGNESVTYSLRLWIRDDISDVKNMMNKSFTSKITLTATYIPTEVINEKELYNIVAKQASLDNIQSEFVTSDTGINFGEAPSDTNGKGVYTIADTKDYEYPVHYFRGAVTNNNVKFAGFCWKVVRTTETGGVKLIYNGTPNSEGGCTVTGKARQIGASAFNVKYDSADYVGYMYPESTNANNSAIKTVIDNWYNQNMTTYTDMLEDTIWCSDRSIYTIDKDTNNITYFGSKRNFLTYEPSIVCPNDNDKFTVNSANGNGKLTYPIALLTVDEATLAGHGLSGYSSSSYLSIEQEYWLLSPDAFSGNAASIYSIRSDGSLHRNNVSIFEHYYARPSISLAPGTEVTDQGDGSGNSPYEIAVE